TAQACDKSHLERVNSYTEDNRNRCSRGLCRKCRRSATGCRNHCHLTLKQLRRKRRQSLVVTLCPTVFDFGVLALNIADLSQTLTKGAQTMLTQVRRCIAEKPDYRYRGLLRARRERPPSRRAAEQRDELASSHVEHRGVLPRGGRRSVYRMLNLPQRGHKVLGADLNCSESRRRRHTMRQKTAALRDFSPVFVRFGSIATQEVETRRSPMSAWPRKRRSAIKARLRR